MTDTAKQVEAPLGDPLIEDPIVFLVRYELESLGISLDNPRVDRIVKRCHAHNGCVRALEAVVAAYKTHQVYDKSPLTMVEAALAAHAEAFS